MDKFQFVRDGVTRLPPGFRFLPTDEELVFQYLKCKVFSSPLPAPIIPHINICKYDPWDLPGNLEQERYFFSNKEAKYPNGSRINRATASGYWKATGLDKQILSSSRINQMLMGMKKTLVFYRGKAPHDSRTDWIMHEYRLVTAATAQASLRNYSKEIENWVICKIFMKKRTMKDDANDDNNGVALPDQPQSRFYDFMMTDRSGSCAASSSRSSASSYRGISEVSSNGSEYDDDDDDGESSSSGNNIYFLN